MITCTCRILVTHLPDYASQAKMVTWHIKHAKQDEMAKKLVIVSLKCACNLAIPSL